MSDEIKEEKREESNEFSNKSGRLNAEKLRSNPWILSTFVLGILVLILVLQSFGVLGGNLTGKVVSQDLVSNNVDLVLKNVFGLSDYEILSINRQDDFYKIAVFNNGTSYDFQTTLDGEFVRVPNGIWIKMSELKLALEMEQNQQAISDSGFATGGTSETPNETENKV